MYFAKGRNNTQLQVNYTNRVWRVYLCLLCDVRVVVVVDVCAVVVCVRLKETSVVCVVRLFFLKKYALSKRRKALEERRSSTFWGPFF